MDKNNPRCDVHMYPKKPNIEFMCLKPKNFGGCNLFSPIKIMGPNLTTTENIPTNEKVHSILIWLYKVPQICLKLRNQLLKTFSFHH